MIKKVIYLTVLAGVLFLLNSCFTLFFRANEDQYYRDIRIVEWAYNPALSEDKTAKIMFFFDFKTYNDFDVSEVFKSKRNYHIKPLITIPEGAAAFTFDTGFWRTGAYSDTYYSVKDCSFKYNFKAGQKYFISIKSDVKSKQTLIEHAQYSYYVKIYNDYPEHTGERMTRKQYEAYTAALDNRLIETIHLFDTDKLVF